MFRDPNVSGSQPRGHFGGASRGHDAIVGGGERAPAAPNTPHSNEPQPERERETRSANR